MLERKGSFKCLHSTTLATNEYLTRMTRRQSKIRGTQMLNFKIDLSAGE